MQHNNTLFSMLLNQHNINFDDDDDQTVENDQQTMMTPSERSQAIEELFLKPHDQASMMIPIEHQISSFARVQGLGLYCIPWHPTGNGSAVFINAPHKTKKTSAIQLTNVRYDVEEDVDRFYVFNGFERWNETAMADVDYVEFVRLHSPRRILDSSATVESPKLQRSEDDEEPFFPAIDMDTVVFEDFNVTPVMKQAREKCQSQAIQPNASVYKPRDFRSTAISKQRPSCRIYHSTAFDSQNNCVYIYGGFTRGRIMSNDIIKMTFTTKETADESSSSSNNDDCVCQSEILTNKFKLIRKTEANDDLDRIPYREGHTAVMRRGKMYVLGGNAGRNGTFEKELLVFDFETYTIEPVNVKGDLFSHRAYHSATYLEKYDIMVVCGGKLRPGQGAPLSSQCFIYHFATSTWELLDPTIFRMPTLSGHQVLKISNSVIAVVGGSHVAYGKASDMSKFIYLYDVESREFCSFDLTHYGYKGRYSMPAAYSEKSKLIAIGGGYCNDCDESLSLIYLDITRSASKHFHHRLLKPKYYDISVVTCEGTSSI
ncbi:hypothetical protein C9374_007287 [Naegleria lovaniensis]|uniref:Uncharacterized protein n=1 Tax=Naegleria lovaniensis TaxID=51637 RepID=A0AA88KS13_NAELO|nr:uncharacterized protein C9374_007287 [Naegleria lovaniensis]KAG2393756.1 hypothetical protein C9374_007287 [Naegleria lovaniensis]